VTFQTLRVADGIVHSLRSYLGLVVTVAAHLHRVGGEQSEGIGPARVNVAG
jgi:hypothetical protein